MPGYHNNNYKLKANARYILFQFYRKMLKHFLKGCLLLQKCPYNYFICAMHCALHADCRIILTQ